MRILILNWRDIDNPTGGGAEVLTHEIAKRWVKDGHDVILFSSTYEGARSEDIRDGVRIIRRGHPDIRTFIFSVHFQAFLYYIRVFRNHVDVIVDEIHGIPFFTPLYVKERKIALICEVADDLWKKLFGVFFGLIGKTTEQVYFRFVYRKTKFLTISPSTKKALQREGIPEERIMVLPMGVTVPKTVKDHEKEKQTTFIFVGRLTKSKGIEDAIRAVALYRHHDPHAKLWIIGRGDASYQAYLSELAKFLGISQAIIFWGFVSEEKKFLLLSRSHILIAPSVMEGWGLTIPEAGYVGTPAVAYNTHGLRDVIDDGKTGILCSENSPEVLADRMIQLLRDKQGYRKMQHNARQLARSYTWDKTARVAIDVIMNL